MSVILLIGLGKLGPSVVAGAVLAVVCDNNLSKLVYSRKGRQAPVYHIHKLVIFFLISNVCELIVNCVYVCVCQLVSGC